ncbi:MAG: hypothetical protein U0800_11870 [Isosphaeraceae bacterium]
MRWNLGRAMLAIGAIAALFAIVRAAALAYPHARRCWDLAVQEDQLGQAYLLSAARYEGCLQAVPCLPSQYCNNACLAHVSSRSIPQDIQKQHVAEQHRQAAQDHREAARVCAEMARRYREAAFHPSRPMPSWIDTRSVSNRYQCDSY